MPITRVGVSMAGWIGDSGKGMTDRPRWRSGCMVFVHLSWWRGSLFSHLRGATMYIMYEGTCSKASRHLCAVVPLSTLQRTSNIVNGTSIKMAVLPGWQDRFPAELPSAHFAASQVPAPLRHPAESLCRGLMEKIRQQSSGYDG